MIGMCCRLLCVVEHIEPDLCHHLLCELVMSGCEELIKELADLSAFLKAREGLPGDPALKAKVSTNMVLGFTKKILSLSAFNAEKALVFTNAIMESDLDATQRDAIQHAVDTRLDGSVSNTYASRVSHTPQKLTSQLTSYLTASDWSSIHNERVSLAGKMQVIVDRFQRLGLRYAHEQTVKWAVAVLALQVTRSSGSYPPYSAILGMVHDFKATMDACRNIQYAHGHITAYPASPADLPDVVYQSAYDDGDPPVVVVIERLANTAENHVPLRSSSALLRKDEPKAPSNSSVASMAAQPVLEQLVALLGGQLPNITMLNPRQQHVRRPQSPMLTSGGAEDPSSPSTDDSQRTMGAARSPLHLALADNSASAGGDGANLQLAITSSAQSAGGGVAGVHVAPVLRQPMASVPRVEPVHAFKPRVTVAVPSAPQDGAEGRSEALGMDAAGGLGGERQSAEAYEAAAFKALLKRNEKRKVERVGSAGDGAPTALLKRPAAAPKDVAAELPDFAVEWTEADGYKGRNDFTSKWYHRAKKHAKAHGLSDERASELARAAHREAGMLFESKSKTT